MPVVLKRIVLNGLLTAAILAVVGLGFAQLGAIWLAGSVGRTAPVVPAHNPAAPPATDPVQDVLWHRVPLAMAGWGFAFVVVGELLLAFRRRNRPAAVVPPPPDEPKPDPAEALLEDLLRQVEAGQVEPLSGAAEKVELKR